MAPGPSGLFTTTRPVERGVRITDTRRMRVLQALLPQARTLTVYADDDDAFCRANNVKTGSPEYVACRKDRDVQRNNANTRADRAQRNLGEYMLNNPGHP